MSALLAALSPDGSRIAALIPTPGSSMRVQILATSTAALQSTLLHRRKETSDALPEKIMFISDRLVALYCSDLIVFWDLNRGVVASTVTPKKEHFYRDAVTCNGKLYALVWSNEYKKAQIHCFDPETSKVEQKIKAGKGEVLALAVYENTAVVRQEDSLRIIDVANGQKIAKYTSIKTSSSQLVAIGDVVVTLESGAAILVHRTSGKLLECIPLEHADDDLDVWKQGKEDVFYLRIGSKVYSISKDGSESTMKCRISAAPSVDRRVVLGRAKSVYALLQQGDQFQSCQATLDKEEAELYWKEPESKEKTAVKRKDAVAVLGPTQTGGEAVGITDGPATKKLKKKQEDDDVEMKNTDDDEDIEEKKEKDDEGPSIAERLANLRDAIEGDGDDDGDDDDEEEDETSHKSGDKKKKKLTSVNLKKITTESLTELLEQALQSTDKSMLEQVLPTNDDQKVEATCERLSDEHLLLLLQELTARLASTPGRASQLCVWFKAVLKTGRIRSMEHLQPLYNILEERLAIFPALLKLEGRLTAMVNQ
eukprot:scaffold5_cov169-Amphora_coffeaeformis.AAC.11